MVRSKTLETLFKPILRRFPTFLIYPAINLRKLLGRITKILESIALQSLISSAIETN